MGGACRLEAGSGRKHRRPWTTSSPDVHSRGAVSKPQAHLSVDGGHEILACKARPSQRPGRDWTCPCMDLESWQVILHPVSGDAQACGSRVARASDFSRTWKSGLFYMLSPGF